MEIRQTLHDETVQAGLREGPRLVIARVQAAMLARAQRLQVTWKLLLSRHDLFGTNRNALQLEQPGELHFRVRTGTAYARALEEGTGPAAGKPAYFPNPAHLYAFVKQRSGIRWSGRPGSRARLDEMREVRDRAWALARYIARHGTKPHPTAAPALEEHREAFASDVRIAALIGAREAFSAQLSALRGSRA